MGYYPQESLYKPYKYHGYTVRGTPNCPLKGNTWSYALIIYNSWLLLPMPPKKIVVTLNSPFPIIHPKNRTLDYTSESIITLWSVEDLITFTNFRTFYQLPDLPKVVEVPSIQRHRKEAVRDLTHITHLPKHPWEKRGLGKSKNNEAIQKGLSVWECYGWNPAGNQCFWAIMVAGVVLFQWWPR